MAALQDGFRQRVLRSTPHLVLTSKAFYHAHLKPLLAQWMSLYLTGDCKVTGVPDQQLLEYVQTEHLYTIQCVARNMYTEE